MPNSVIDKEIVRTVLDGEQAVVNYLTVGIGYDSDMDRAIDILKKTVLAHKDFFDNRKPEEIRQGAPRDVTVAVMELAASAVMLRATVWSKDAGTGFMMLSDLRRTLLKRFREAGIEIPYAYQNVIMKDAGQ